MRKLVAAISVVVLLGAGYAVAQQPGKDDTNDDAVDRFMNGPFRFYKDYQAKAKELFAQSPRPAGPEVRKILHELQARDAHIYADVASDTTATRRVLLLIFNDYYDPGLRGIGIQNAAEATMKMQALQVAQNARIIDLLEKMTAKNK